MKEKYITDDEKEKCRKVADTFAELYEIENILVVDAGRYGFVKLQYYKPPQGFEDAITFTDSKSMFENLWEEWFDTQLFFWQKEHQWLEWDTVKYLSVYQKKNRRSSSIKKLSL